MQPCAIYLVLKASHMPFACLSLSFFFLFFFLFSFFFYYYFFFFEAFLVPPPVPIASIVPSCPLHWSSPMPLACIPARPSLLFMIPTESPCLTHVSQLGPPTMQPCAIISCTPASHTPFACLFLLLLLLFFRKPS